MIGKITWQDEDGSHALTLEDSGKVSCDVASVREAVTRRFEEYRADYSPADGSFGAGFLAQVAKGLQGKLELEKKKAPKSKDGEPVVY